MPEKQKTILIDQNFRLWKGFFWEAVLFSLTLGLGIITAFKLKAFFEIKQSFQQGISFWEFIIYFFSATLFIFLISYFGKRVKKGKKILFQIIFILATIYGGLVVISLWILDIFTLILMGVLLLWWLIKPLVFIHNLIVILGLAGIGAILGLSFNPSTVVALLIFLSVYDFIAVYKTKHMVEMAKEMIAHQTILGLIIPQRISDFKENLKEVKPGGKFLILGGGDVIFPLLLCVSLLSEGVFNSLIVAFFALIGLSISFYLFINQKTRQPIPALPPIALFSILGYLITLII